MLTIKLAAKTSLPIGSKPKSFPFHAHPTNSIPELEQAKTYARGQLRSTGRAWVSVEDGKVLYFVGLNADGTLYEWERAVEPKPKPSKPAKAA